MMELTEVRGSSEKEGGEFTELLCWVHKAQAKETRTSLLNVTMPTSKANTGGLVDMCSIWQLVQRSCLWQCQ